MKEKDISSKKTALLAKETDVTGALKKRLEEGEKRHAREAAAREKERHERAKVAEEKEEENVVLRAQVEGSLFQSLHGRWKSSVRDDNKNALCHRARR